MKNYLPLFVVLFLFVTSCSNDEKPVQYELTTTVNPTGSGSINPSTRSFDSGENIKLTATPAEGYVFTNWSGDVSSSDNPVNLILDTDKNIIAVFEKFDNDNDGVPEVEDQCPDTPSGEVVDENGCSDTQKDIDGDGVTDNVDKCPDTEEGVEVNASGCTTETNEAGGEVVEDIDADGVNDNDDQCPDTPKTENVDENGCSNSQKDTDNDGVNDDIDVCPKTTEGETVDENGCVPDLTTFVPDDAFEQLLIDWGYDDVLDDNVLTENIASVEDLTLNGETNIIANLTGLEAFVSLRNLTISGGSGDENFTLSGANHPNLTTLSFFNASLNSIEINENSKLETITGAMNLETLHVINNSSLTQIDLEDSRINSVNLAGNTRLEFFTILDGNLGDIAISDNPVFNRFAVTVDGIRSLDISNNTALEIFVMEVEADVDYLLDFSTSPNLKIIDIGFIIGDGLQYSSLNIKQNTLLEILNISGSGLTDLDISNNSNLIDLDASENTSLSCIKVNQDQLTAIPSGWIKDPESVYALECPE